MKHKKIFAFLFVLILIIGALLYGIMGGKREKPSKVEQAQKNANNRILIVFYSYSGTTKRVADKLQQITGGDLYEVKPAKAYSEDSNVATARLMLERSTHNMPELAGNLPDISGYDTILIGTPVWNTDVSNPIMSYMEKNDFSGKTVAPFWTSAGSDENTASSFGKLAGSATYKEGLGLTGARTYSEDKLQSTLTNWLAKVHS